MARKRDNIALLAKFTSDELAAEVARRGNDGKWGYVVIDDSEAGEDDDPRFGIVTPEHWNKYQCIEDYSLCNSVLLPAGFTEVQEATYDFLDGDLTYGEELLQKAGFVRLGVMDI